MYNISYQKFGGNTMNRKLFAGLAERCRAGDPDALEQLLLQAHTPIAHVSGKLLQNRSAAQSVTRDVLALVADQLNVLEDPQDCERWIRRITAARCMPVMHRLFRDGIELDTPESVQIPRKALDEIQTALAMQQMVDLLPEQPRLCLLLYCCGGMEVEGVARLTGLTEAEVLDNLARAQDNINNQRRKFHKMGIRFVKLTSLPELLQTAMYQSADPEAAQILVDDILRKREPIPAIAPAAPSKKQPDTLRVLLIGAAASACLLAGTVILALISAC